MPRSKSKASRRLPVLKDSDTQLHGRWLGQLLPGPLPREPLATCNNCVMVPPPGAGAGDEAHFNPATKCCTYHPKLANFLVGRVLSDDAADLAEGRARVQERLRARVGVSPLGVVPPSQFDRLYETKANVFGNVFGRTKALRCPYYLEHQGGACGIWRHRNGVCRNWYCKHERGRFGQQLWRALEQLMIAVETALAQFCVVQLDVGAQAMRELFPHPGTLMAKSDLDGDDLDGRVNEAKYRARWGKWYGHEEAFFARAAELVEPLTGQDVTRIAGAEAEVLLRMVRDAYAEVTKPVLPARISVGSFQVTGMADGVVRLKAYSILDPIELSEDLFAVLSAFDGGSPTRALRSIEREHDLTLEPALVQKLVDFGVLTETPVPKD